MEVAGVMLQVMYTGIMPIKKITEQRVRAHLLIFFLRQKLSLGFGLEFEFGLGLTLGLELGLEFGLGLGLGLGLG